VNLQLREQDDIKDKGGARPKRIAQHSIDRADFKGKRSCNPKKICPVFLLPQK
jgi:hypothetical protein